jgi:hypothetical protein
MAKIAATELNPIFQVQFCPASRASSLLTRFHG